MLDYSSVLISVHNLVNTYRNRKDSFSNPVTQLFGNWQTNNNVTLKIVYKDKKTAEYPLDTDFMPAVVKSNSNSYHGQLRQGKLENGEKPVITAYNLLAYAMVGLINGRIGSDINALRTDVVYTMLKAMNIASVDVVCHDWKSGGKGKPEEKVYTWLIVKNILSANKPFSDAIKKQEKVYAEKARRAIPVAKGSKRDAKGIPGF